jgi:hypothetical protein
MGTTSNRELARQVGVSETAVRRAEKSGRIRREADGSWDLGRVQAAWSGNTDRSRQRPGLMQRSGRPDQPDLKQRSGRSGNAAVRLRSARSGRRSASMASRWSPAR